MTLLLIYFSLAVGISFLCSMLETILLSISLSHINVIKKTNLPIGKKLEKLKKEINTSLASILILNTAANTLGAAGVGAEASLIFGTEYMFYVSAILTLVILFVSEIIPKTIGAIYYKELAPIAARLISFFIFITYPLIIVSLSLTKKISRSKTSHSITREELLESTLISEDDGVIDEKESDYIENILRLHKSKVEQILTPRSVIFALDKNMQIQEALKRPEIKRFSRIPVYEDTIDNIIGVVLSKQIFEEAISNHKTKLSDLMEPIFAINEHIPVSYTLDLFIKRKEHMFLVTDSYGQTEGIVTLEDCIETLLGVEIMDERDTTEDMQKLAKDRMRRKKNKKLKKKLERQKKLLHELQEKNVSPETSSKKK
ncbi:CNNM domain-containing protein [Sulfurospirillum sp. 1612]|uniref:CNNM domain-containing protein n=1 Tax=Sulfurospirillum sp. 1612 TaxID=3094835 RepID=UPI002F9285EE